MKTNGAWAFSFEQVHEILFLRIALKIFCSLFFAAACITLSF